jgi:hypothetical protein
VLEAKFLRDDLSYFVELLGEVASSTKYQRTLSASNSDGSMELT